MKYEILRLLKDSEGFVSGEDISRGLGVSRTAIWKCINTLKEEGYVIDSSSRKGYRLSSSPDLLTSEEVIPVLNTAYAGREIIHYDSIDSTNNAARAKAAGAREGLLVTAEEQTKGKGRLGRNWSTPKSQSIAFSMVLKPRIKPEGAAGITLVMGTAVCRAIRSLTGLDAGIKWPNDIIVNGKKVCGILTEMNAEVDVVNYIVVGVGINVNMTCFPEELKDIATSLCLELGCSVSRRDIIASVLLEFEGLYEEFKMRGLKNILNEFKGYSVTFGKHVKVISINESFEGEAVDITEEGLLVVKTMDNDERKVISGDVSVRGVSGCV